MQMQSPLFAMLVLPCALMAQNMVEYSAGAARAGATAGAKDASKSVGGVFGSLSKTLEKAENAEPAAPASSSPDSPGDSASSPARAVSTKPKPLEPAEVEVGMDRSTLLKRFGKPLMKTSKVDGTAYLEVFYYPHPDEDMTVVTLRDGKVTSVTPAPPAARKQGAPG